MWQAIVADPSAAQLAHTPRLVAAAGGYPILANGMVVGGLGIAGGSAQQDQAIAEQALRALGFDVQ